MRLIGIALVAASAILAAAEDGQETIFNGVKVPPFMQLSQSNWETEIKKSKWTMVKHFRYASNLRRP